MNIHCGYTFLKKENREKLLKRTAVFSGSGKKQPFLSNIYAEYLQKTIDIPAREWYGIHIPAEENRSFTALPRIRGGKNT